MIEIPEPIKKMMDKYGEEFRDVFGVQVSMFAGMLWTVGITDFDIIKFERFLNNVGYDSYSDEESMAGFVKRKYGERAEKLIHELIAM